MARPTIEAVSDATLPEFAGFLQANLNPHWSPAQWEQGLRANWMPGRQNYGFVMRDAGQIVGGIGAIYAERRVAGVAQRFCNITSWCVLDAFRKQSMRLAMAVIEQPGFHFTDFSPTPIVGGVLRFLKFKPIDERQTVILNLPMPLAGGRVLADPRAIEASLAGDALQAYRDHAAIPWLRHVALGDGSHWCHVIYKRRMFKGMPSAHLLHVGDVSVLARYLRSLCSHLLMHGMFSTHVETRSLSRPVWPSRIRSGFNAKLFLSDRLAESDIDYLYSESVAMDL